MQINEYVLNREYSFASADDISEADAVGYLAALRAVALSDGIVEEEERFIQTVGGALGVTRSVMESAAKRAASVALPALLEDLDDGALRACLYRDAYRLALADGVVSDDEEQALQRVAEALRLPLDTVASLEGWVQDDLALQVRLGELLVASSEL